MSFKKIGYINLQLYTLGITNFPPIKLKKEEIAMLGDIQTGNPGLMANVS